MENITENKENIKSAIEFIVQKKYTEAEQYVNEAYQSAKESNDSSIISICLTLNAFLKYSTGETNTQQGIEEGCFMAQKSEDLSALLINEMIKGNINFSENDKNVALIHYNNALKLSAQKDEYNLSDLINTRI